MFSSVLQRIHRSFRLATHLRDADAALYRAKGRGGTDSLSAMSFRPNYEPQMNRAGQESQSCRLRAARPAPPVVPVRRTNHHGAGAPKSLSHIVAAGEFRRLRPGHTVLHERGVDPSRGLCLVRPYGDGTFLGTLSFARSPSRCQGRAECPSKRIRRDRFPDRHQAVTSVRVFAAAS